MRGPVDEMEDGTELPTRELKLTTCSRSLTDSSPRPQEDRRASLLSQSDLRARPPPSPVPEIFHRHLHPSPRARRWYVPPLPSSPHTLTWMECRSATGSCERYDACFDRCGTPSVRLRLRHLPRVLPIPLHACPSRPFHTRHSYRTLLQPTSIESCGRPVRNGRRDGKYDLVGSYDGGGEEFA